MKFKVSAKVKGSLILKSLGRAVSAGSTVYVEGNALYADDIQRAIKVGLLTPLTEEEKVEVKEKIIDKTNEAVIINKTDRVVIVGNFPIRPNGSAIKDLNKLDMNALRKSVENGLVQVITDVDEGVFDDATEEEVIETPPVEETKPVEVDELSDGIDILEDTPTELSPEDELAQLIKEAEGIVEDKVEPAPEPEEMSEEREDGSKCVVWDFRAQETKKPKVVPKTIQKMITEEEDDVDMVDALDEVNEEDEEIQSITDKIEKMKKQLAQKKASKKKAPKKKDSKVIKTKFNKESEEDIAQALDSMGNPLSDDMTHMIDAANGTEISFCDQEQAQQKIDLAKKQGNSIDLDLD